MIQEYQARFVEFLLASRALTFGDFVTKSGRQTPYFVNTGLFNDGAKIGRLGEFYAEHIKRNFARTPSVVFGPAYKGVPLAVTTAIALQSKHGLNIHYTFDRKELKDHGDKGRLVGYTPVSGDRIVLVEDVITAGTTLREIVPFIRGLGEVELVGAVIAVDRCERGAGNLSAVAEAEAEMKVKILPIVTIHQIIDYLSQNKINGFEFSAELRSRIDIYLESYGAR